VEQDMQVGELMTRNVPILCPDDSLRVAAYKMDEFNVGALPVCDGERLIGIVSDRDITVRCTSIGASPDQTPVTEAMTEDVCWCFVDDPVEEVERVMAKRHVRRMPVVDRDEHLVGMVSLGDLATREVPGSGETLRTISAPSRSDRPARRR
jgi:CBS domain-containing protein